MHHFLPRRMRGESNNRVAAGFPVATLATPCEHIVDTLVRKACRSLHFFPPTEASMTLLAIADLAVPLPVRPLTLLKCVAPRLGEYTLTDTTRVFEALSRLHLSHHLVTAHMLKRLLRKLSVEIAPPTFAGNPRRGSWETAFPKVILCVCDAIVTLQRWHTPRTLLCFLVAVEAVLGPVVSADDASKRTAEGHSTAESRHRGMVLLLFEAYVQSKLLSSAAHERCGTRTTTQRGASDIFPFLCAALRAVLEHLTESDATRITLFLPCIGDRATAAVSMLRVVSQHALLRVLLRDDDAQGSRAPTDATSSGGRMFARASPTGGFLPDACVRLSAACRRAREGSQTALAALFPLLTETCALFQSAALPKPESATGLAGNCGIIEQHALLHVTLDVTRQLCCLAGKDDAARHLRDAVSTWLGVAWPFLKALLTTWVCDVAGRYKELRRRLASGEAVFTLSASAPYRSDWLVLVTAVDLCAAHVPSSLVPTDMVRTTVDAARTGLHWLSFTFQALAESDCADTLGGLRTCAVVALLALVYASTGGSLVAVSLSDDTTYSGSEVRVSVRTACRLMLPLGVTTVHEYLYMTPAHPSPSSACPCEKGADTAVLDSVSALVSAMTQSMALRTHVALHIIRVLSSSPSVSPHSPAFTLGDSTDAETLTETLLALFIASHTALAQVTRSATHVWSRLVASPCLTTVTPTRHTLHIAPATEPLHGPLEESAVDGLVRWGKLCDATSTLKPGEVHSRETTDPLCLGQQPSPQHAPLTAYATRQPRSWEGGDTVTFPRPCASYSQFVEVEHFLAGVVRALVRVPLAPAKASSKAEGILFYARFIAWYIGVVYEACLRASDEVVGTADTLLAAQLAQVLAIVAVRRTLIADVHAALLECGCDKNNNMNSNSDSTGCLDECKALCVFLDVALLPRQMAHMVRARLVPCACGTAFLEVASFLSRLARVVRLPRRHAPLFRNLFDAIEQISSLVCTKPRVGTWCREAHTLFDRPPPNETAPLRPRQLVAFLVRATRLLASSSSLAGTAGTHRASTFAHPNTAQLPAFLNTLAQGLPLLGVWPHDRRGGLTDDELACAVVSSVSLVVVLDLVELADPLVGPCTMASGTNPARELCVRLAAVRDEFLQLSNEHTVSYISCVTVTDAREAVRTAGQIRLLLTVTERMAELTQRILAQRL